MESGPYSFVLGAAKKRLAASFCTINVMHGMLEDRHRSLVTMGVVM